MVLRKKRGKPKPKPKPVINYPPVPTKKWIPPDQRPKKGKPPPAYTKPSGMNQKLTTSSLKKIWHQFTIYGRTGVLPGHFSQTHKKFNSKTNGYQGACNCAVACAFAHLVKMHRWTRSVMDIILHLGDVLYVKSTQQESGRCLTLVPPEHVFNSFFLKRTKVLLSIDEGAKVAETLPTVTEQKIRELMGKSVGEFFKMYPSGIFALGEKYLAIWRDGDTYYVFDPTDHEENGQAWTGVPGLGCAVLFRTKTLEDMVVNICDNVNAKIPRTKYEILQCVVSRITKINTTPPETFEDFLNKEEIEDMVVLLEDDLAATKPIDVVEEKLRNYMEKSKEEDASLKIKLEEISPEVTESLPPSRRPSWLQGSIDKKDECMFPIPRKPHLDKISFYVEIVPESVFILRGTTCQTDPKFSKYEGKQSMGNAVSALIMLRFHKSKVWVPRLVNEVLRYGELLYRDAMVSIPRARSLKLSHFQRKTEYENRTFAPVVRDYVVVGKLQSIDYDVLDLLPALENYLIDHECCVVLGPLTLAVWVEDGYYYWFDPNERDKNGKVVTKCEPEEGLGVDRTPGVACVIRFVNLNDLVKLYMLNVEKPHKYDPFYISDVQINDYVEIPDPWFTYQGLTPGKWILRATVSQASKFFSKESRNFQCTANCLVALACQAMLPEQYWSRLTVNRIIGMGDSLYLQSLAHLKSEDRFVSKMLTLSEVNNKMMIDDKMIDIIMGECCINGVINAKRYPNVMDLKKGLVKFFEDHETGVLSSHNISVAVWKTDGVYYVFDGHSRNDKGLAAINGTGCVLRIVDLDEVVRSVEVNLSPSKEDFYNLSWVKVKYCKSEDGAPLPPLHHYVDIEDTSAILRSLYSENSGKYDPNCGKQSVPMCLAALAYNKLKPAAEWTKTDLDEVLNKGNDFYTDTVNDILKREQNAEERDEERDEEETEGAKEQQIQRDGMVDLNNVNKEFFIGLNKMTFEFEDFSEGNIRENLRDALKSYFNQQQTEENFNQEALIDSNPLTVAVWRDDKLYYCFDPKPRDTEGLVIGAEEWSFFEPPVYEEEYERDVQDEEQELVEPEQDDNDEEEEGETNVEGIEDEGDELQNEDLGGGDHEQTPKEENEPEEWVNEEGQGPEDGEVPVPQMPSTLSIPNVHRSDSYWRERERSGRACTMWFTGLEELADHIYGNISPRDGYENGFLLRSVHITNSAMVKNRLRPEDKRNDVYSGNWYDFRELDHGKWIMRGTMNLRNEMFPADNRGKQQVTASYVAVALAYLFSMLCFDKYTVDTILIYGDKLYTFMKRMRKKFLQEIRDAKLKEADIDWLVQHEEYELRDIVNKICIWKFYVEMHVDQDYLSGDVNSKVDDVLDVERALEEFFADNQYGIMQCKDLTVAIWRGNKVYFMFDGMNRGPNGVVSLNGTACITRYLDLQEMSKVFLANLSHYGRNTFSIHRVTMTRDVCPRAREPKELKENPRKRGVSGTGGFQAVVAGKCIVRGTLSILDPKFTQNPAFLSGPIAIVALTMSLIHKPNTWSKPLVDDILRLGAELSDESVNELGYEFNPWEDVLDVLKVKNDYRIGVLKANCEFRNRDQKGVIDTKDPHVLNLRQGIEQFFEENTHGVLTAANLTLAVWEEEEEEEEHHHSEALIYMFDPNPRGPTGMPLDTGAACVMTFANAKVASDHVQACLLDPEHKSAEFAIVPVEIVVGTARTKRKTKRKAASETGVLPRCSKLVANEQKRTLRKIAAEERKRRQAKKQQKIGRHGYHLMMNGEAVLRGYKSQNSKAYNEHSRNNQDITNCMAAIVAHTMHPIQSWTAKDVDAVLDAGDQLYVDSYIAYAPRDKKLGPENVIRNFYVGESRVHVTVYKPIISDVFNVNNLNRILNVYFQQESHCMLSYAGQWVSIFAKEGYFYVFDPHERNMEGNRVKRDEEGWATVVKLGDSNGLTLKLVQNLFLDLEEAQAAEKFYVWLISVEVK